MITIVIPVYNEGKNINLLLEKLPTEVKQDFSALIVYDTEEDDTLAAIREHGGYPFEVKCQKNMYGRGFGNAARTAVKIVISGDGQSYYKTPFATIITSE